MILQQHQEGIFIGLFRVVALIVALDEILSLVVWTKHLGWSAITLENSSISLTLVELSI